MTIKKTVTSKRKYGTYPGAISDEELQKLKNCSEIDLYFNIKATENFIKTSKHAVGICPFLDEFQYSLEYYVMQSKDLVSNLKNQIIMNMYFQLNHTKNGIVGGITTLMLCQIMNILNLE